MPTREPAAAGRTDVWSWPGCAGGLVGDRPARREDYAAYRSAGGYGADRVRPDVCFAGLASNPAVRQLLGRGGAAYPFWPKLTTVRAAALASGRRPKVVANGSEGEPLSVKDRYLMRHRPHAVLDGLRWAALALDADEVHVYVADALSRQSLREAHDESVAAGTAIPALAFTVSQSTYIAGEASAAVRSIETGVARPRDRGIGLEESGIDGAPTLVSNVETLARVAQAMRDAPDANPLLVTVSGPDVGAALVEVPADLPVLDLLTALGLGNQSRSALLGGFFGGLLPVTADLAFSAGSMAAHGGALGCASIYLLGSAETPASVAASVAAYYAMNNAGQCRSCVEGTKAVAAALGGAGTDPLETQASLGRWSTQLVGRGACSLPDGVAVLLRSLLRHYPDQLSAHLDAVDGPAAAGSHASIREVAVPVPEPAGNHADRRELAGSPA